MRAVGEDDTMITLSRPSAEIHVPDGTAIDAALARTTHLAIGAHQDDVEIMAADGILQAFERPDRWFTAVVVTDGAGSPRSGAYGGYSDAMMREVRRDEQKKAAGLGEYAAAILLDHPTVALKDPARREVVDDLAACRVLEGDGRVIEQDGGGVLPESRGLLLLVAADLAHHGVGVAAVRARARRARAIGDDDGGEPPVGPLEGLENPVGRHDLDVVLVRADGQVRRAGQGSVDGGAVGHVNLGRWPRKRDHRVVLAHGAHGRRGMLLHLRTRYAWRQP